MASSSASAVNTGASGSAADDVCACDAPTVWSKSETTVTNRTAATKIVLLLGISLSISFSIGSSLATGDEDHSI